MKKSLVIVATLVVGMLLGAVAMGTAFAAGPTPGTSATPFVPGSGFGRGGMMGQGQGFGAMMGGDYGFEDEVLTLLGMTREQLIVERQAGKSLVQIAQEKGKTQQQLVDTILAAKRADLDALVAAKTLTQAQADLMYQNMQQAVPLAVNSTAIGGRMGNGNVTPGDCPMWDGDETPTNGQQFGRGGMMGGRGGMMRGTRTNGPSA